MIEVLGAVILCLLLFAGMLGLIEGGFRLGQRFERARGGETTSIFDSAVFALLGLLLGFAFAGAIDRLNIRRNLIVQEANAIGTAYLRIDMLQPEDQPAIRTLSAPTWMQGSRSMAQSTLTVIPRAHSRGQKSCRARSGAAPLRLSGARTPDTPPKSSCPRSTT